MSDRTGVPDATATGEPIRLRLLGRFALTVGGQEVPLSPNARRLLAYLALQGRWTARTQAATALWPRAEPPRAAANLRSVLWRVTRTVGRVIVVADTHSLRLDQDIAVDVADIERDARRCDGASPFHPGLDDVECLSVDLLPDWSEDWAIAHRECFRQLRLRALEQLSAQHRRSGRLRQAMELALTAVSAEPLRESAHRQLVEVHLAEGNAAEAVRQYELYRRMLRRQLGLVPSTAMRRLVAPLLACPARPA